MTVRLSIYQKAEQELYKLERGVKAEFYDFSHKFRANPKDPGLRLKKLKGDDRIYSARIGIHYRALLTRAGTGPGGEDSWLLVAVRHRKDVYDQLSVAVNRITGEIEFVDLSIVGESALRRAGITLTPDEPDTDDDTPSVTKTPAPSSQPTAPDAAPLLAAYSEQQLAEFGVAPPLIKLALAVTSSAELDELVAGAPLLSKDVLYGLAAGMRPEDVMHEVTDRVSIDAPVDPDDLGAALERTKVTVIGDDDELRAVLEEGDFRAWKKFLHPTQGRLVARDYTGPTRVSGGPGTGKTIVALHRVQHLVEALPAGQDKPILLTTFTKNLAADLRARLSSLLDDPTLIARVDVTHIDQLAARVLGATTTAGRAAKRRIDGPQALYELQTLLAELGEQEFEPAFLLDEWEQVILGQTLTGKHEYFQARRVGRGRLSRPQRDRVWRILEQLTVRLDKQGLETWAQAAERAARLEMERARQAAEHTSAREETILRDDDSGSGQPGYRYRHIVVDEAQDLRPAHWKMLRAMVKPGPNDLFIAGDTHQRIYDNQVSLGALGINIVGRSTRLTLSYRTTKEILASAMALMNGQSYDDLDDGTDTLTGYRSVLTGPSPRLDEYATWAEELRALAATIISWRDEQDSGLNGGRIAVAVAEREKVDDVIRYLTEAGLVCAELTKDGTRGDGEIHVGTMHRFKGLEYQKLAVVAVCDGVLPRVGIERFRDSDPARYRRELQQARSLLFVAVTRARDALSVTWHGTPSAFLRS
ncbi:UvrD-helicase domain-containing protein [Catenulispora sp. NF23]|uniref:UvrD-helicase domain-containing protein n=1 Tax=Catenulispora pinistramenti TaxID=2705254 RepID=UPI001BA779F9|nr:UvrD-helicase domain-containing protein [Catenulispora pinistramenti]MBS2532567.1 UvrD-helicase domain-containing protein [Catenulispora pinistramenti]